MTSIRVVSPKRHLYRWECDDCGAWGTHGPQGRPLADATAAARVHLAEAQEEGAEHLHWVSIFRLIRWVEPEEATR